MGQASWRPALGARRNSMLQYVTDHYITLHTVASTLTSVTCRYLHAELADGVGGEVPVLDQHDQMLHSKGEV